VSQKHPLSGATEVVAEQRPARRAAAIAALITLGLIAGVVAFVILTNFGSFLVLVALFATFFAGVWVALSRAEWWRWAGAAIGVVAGLGVLVAVVGIGAVASGATIFTFLLCVQFGLLTRYALGDRVEVDL
jgi:hypothetical protein